MIKFWPHYDSRELGIGDTQQNTAKFLLKSGVAAAHGAGLPPRALLADETGGSVSLRPWRIQPSDPIHLSR